MLVYTVMIETISSSWAWMKDADDETMYLGSQVGCDWGWYGEHRISDQLVVDFNAWAMGMACLKISQKDSGMQFDWEDCNLCGFVLAKRLKVELGEQASVRYIKPTEDPSYGREEGFEIASDGTVVPIRRLWWTPV